MSLSAQLAILLTLKDLASDKLSDFGKTLKETSTKLIAMGEASRLVGGQMIDMMRGPIAAFAEADDAATQLKTAMMDGAGRVAGEFEAVNDLAIKLGNRMPGTTRDFQKSAPRTRGSTQASAAGYHRSGHHQISASLGAQFVRQAAHCRRHSASSRQALPASSRRTPAR